MMGGTTMTTLGDPGTGYGTSGSEARGDLDKATAWPGPRTGRRAGESGGQGQSVSDDGDVRGRYGEASQERYGYWW